MKTIYFCGSIRGGRSDADLYRRLIKHMKDLGFSVPTEHIGSPEVFRLENDMTDNDIWIQDMSWLESSDLVIAECSTPSLGVGYELAIAKSHNKPVHVLYRQTDRFHSISAMISGDPYFILHPYHDDAQLFETLDVILDQYRC